MRSNYETGHAKNVSYFEQLIAFCSGYGGAYQPSKASMQLPSMEQLLSEAREMLQLVTETLTNYRNAVNTRMTVFDQMPTLASRVVNMLSATEASTKVVEDAQGFLRKIKGIRVSKKEEAALPASPEFDPAMMDENDGDMDEVLITTVSPQPTRTRSAAQTSRDQQIEHFSRLVALLRNEPAYQPNEVELQTSTLEQYLENMRTVHSAVGNALVAWSNARIRRDQLLYGDKNCICNVAKDVKQYIKGVFGNTSPQYRQVSKLRFTRYKLPNK